MIVAAANGEASVITTSDGSTLVGRSALKFLRRSESSVKPQTQGSVATNRLLTLLQRAVSLAHKNWNSTN
jgi:hypothetical protein